MKKKTIQLVSTSLTYIGVPLFTDTNFSNTWRLLTVYTLLLIVVISTCTISARDYSGFDIFIMPASYVAVCSTVLGAIHVLYHHRKLISEMLYQLDSNLYLYDDEHMLDINSQKWYFKEEKIVQLITILKYSNGFFVCLACIPILAELLIYHRIKTFIYPGWTPWRMDNLGMDLFTFFLQFFQACCGVWVNYVMSVLLLAVVVEFVKQYKRLIAAVLSLKLRTSMMVSNQKSNGQKRSFDQAMKENIIHCIRHHQNILKCYQLFRIWFSDFFSLELVICAVTFALALCVVVKASNLSQIINYFTMISFGWINLFIRCLISEIFTSLNDDLALALLHESKWDEANTSNQKLLLLFHQFACRPIRVFGLSIFEATRTTFAKLIRTTYSSYNVLNSTMKK